MPEIATVVVKEPLFLNELPEFKSNIVLAVTDKGSVGTVKFDV